MSLSPENETPRRDGRGEGWKNAGEGKSLNSDHGSRNSDADQSPKKRFDVVPAELKKLPQWLVWRLKELGGKTTKFPYNARTGKLASTTKSETWCSFDCAVARHSKGGYDGIGFVFSETDPYIGIDFDHVLREGKWDGKALEEIYAINGYTETSPGGDGVHVIVRANLKLKKHRKAFPDGTGFEAYTEGRYFTVTANAWNDVGSPTIPESSDAVRRCVEAYLGEGAFEGATSSEGEKDQPKNSTEPGSASIGPDSDMGDWEGLLAKARNARNGQKFVALFDAGDVSPFEGDHSAADLALCCILAFWTGKDRNAIDALFRKSKLMRPKWDELRGEKTYGGKTVEEAIAKTSEVWRPSGKSKKDGCKSARKFKCTDLGNAERLVSQEGENIRYEHASMFWKLWDDTRWKRDETGGIYRKAKSSVRSIYSEVANADDADVRKAISQWAQKSEARERVRAMVDLARFDIKVALTHESLDRDSMVLNCLNGTLDLCTAQLRKHNRDDLLTKLAPVNFDEAAACPRWLEFLERIMAGDKELISFLQRFAGYSLTGSVAEQVLAFPYGSGANGKSTFIEVLAAIWGDYFQRAPASLITKKGDGYEGIPNDMARLCGARMAVTSEVEEGCRMAESRVKDLTGGDRIVARYLRKEFFEFDPTHKLWIVGNHRPQIYGSDLGIWRRILQIPFTVTIPEDERDPRLKDYLIEHELPGILNWCLVGCLDWRQGGLRPPVTVSQATEEYRAEMDSVGQFVEECCKIDAGRAVTKGDLYSAYNDWAEESGLRPLSKNRFGRKLKEKNYEDAKEGGKHIWIGLDTPFSGPI